MDHDLASRRGDAPGFSLQPSSMVQHQEAIKRFSPFALNHEIFERANHPVYSKF
jgi:hypothetical protein